MKNCLEPINRCSFSCRIRIWIQNWTKTTTKPHFDQFLKTSKFCKNGIFLDFLALGTKTIFFKGGGTGWRGPGRTKLAARIWLRQIQILPQVGGPQGRQSVGLHPTAYEPPGTHLHTSCLAPTGMQAPWPPPYINNHGS